MMNTQPNNGSISSTLALLVVFVMASFGVDLVIENADACSVATFPPTCFVPQSTEEASEPPTRPDLLNASYERVRFADGCFADECGDIRFDTVKLAVADLTYDDVDSLDMMGVIVRTTSESDATERLLDSLRPSLGPRCSFDGAVNSNTWGAALSDRVEGEVLIQFTVDPQRYTTLSGMDVSIAFVDQNGNIGPFSHPVRLVIRPSFG